MKIRVLVFFLVGIIVVFSICLFCFHLYGVSWTTEINIDHTTPSGLYYVLEDEYLLDRNGYQPDIFGGMTLVGNPLIQLQLGKTNYPKNKIKWELTENPCFGDGYFKALGMDDWSKTHFMIICYVGFENAQLKICYCTNHPIRGINKLDKQISLLLQSDYIELRNPNNNCNNWDGSND